MRRGGGSRYPVQSFTGSLIFCQWLYVIPVTLFSMSTSSRIQTLALSGNVCKWWVHFWDIVAFFFFGTWKLVTLRGRGYWVGIGPFWGNDSWPLASTWTLNKVAHFSCQATKSTQGGFLCSFIAETSKEIKGYGPVLPSGWCHFVKCTGAKVALSSHSVAAEPLELWKALKNRRVLHGEFQNVLADGEGADGTFMGSLGKEQGWGTKPTTSGADLMRDPILLPCFPHTLPLLSVPKASLSDTPSYLSFSSPCPQITPHLNFPGYLCHGL